MLSKCKSSYESGTRVAKSKKAKMGINSKDKLNRFPFSFELPHCAHVIESITGLFSFSSSALLSMCGLPQVQLISMLSNNRLILREGHTNPLAS